MYQPVLIADGIVGFNCRVLPTDEKVEAEHDESLFEDTWETSNAVPYKVELTFYLADPDGRAYRSNTAPIMRIVRMPLYEQSKDGAAPPSEKAARESGGARRSSSGGSGRTSGGAGDTRPGGGGQPGGGGARPGGGQPGGGMRPSGGGAPPRGGMR